MKHGARIVISSGALWLALGAAGCATTPAPPAGTVTSPIPGHAPDSVHSANTNTGAIPTPPPAPPPAPPPMQVGTTASGGTIVQTGSPSDSGPSADARAVLSTIPDPVPGASSEAVPAPAGNAGAPGSGTGAAGGAAGSAGVVAGAGTAMALRPDSAAVDTSNAAADSSSVPTPSLTEPLGEHPGGHVVTDPASPVGPPGTATAQAPPPAALPANPAPPSPCWRVQVAAVPEQARAKALRDAAQSQLMMDMVIEVEKKLYKVRTKDCLTTEAADRIKQHAIDDGFPGAFRFKPTK